MLKQNYFRTIKKISSSKLRFSSISHPNFSSLTNISCYSSNYSKNSNNSNSDNNSHSYSYSKMSSYFISSVLLTFVSLKQFKAENEFNNQNKSNNEVIYRKSDIIKHNNEQDGLWVLYKDGVYDVTKFLASHPGGKERILQAAGNNLFDFWSQSEFRHHLRSPLVKDLLEEMRIGQLHPDDIDVTTVNYLKSLQLVDTVNKDDLQYPTNHIYDCIIVGSGISGLKTAHSLVNNHNIPTKNILLLEAQDYVGGRVKQLTEFIKGTKIDVGAEFLHGDNTELTKFAEETKQPLRKIFCWAHGDGGPLHKPVNNGYGLYYIQDKEGKERLLRFDAHDSDFESTNKLLHDLSQLNPQSYSDFHSLNDFLKSKNLSDEMIEMVNAGFSNTLCTTSKLLSLKRCIQWENIWHGEGLDDTIETKNNEHKKLNDDDIDEEEEHDFTFVNSFGCLVDYLKNNLQIELNSPVSRIDYSLPSDSKKSPGYDLIKITTLNGITYYTKSIVITSSPHVLKSKVITFQPELSSEIQEALDTTTMNNIVKVILKFSEQPWPSNLHGMIMVNTNKNSEFLLPEMWFRNVDKETENFPDEKAKCYVVGFMTSEYASKIMKLSNTEAINGVLNQMDQVFSLLEPKHMSGNINETHNLSPSSLRKPSEVFLGGTFWHWNPQHHPYIGGGYSSPVAGKATFLGDKLSKPYGNNNIFFAGEATSLPGATAHAALESGVRAASQVSSYLKEKEFE